MKSNLFLKLMITASLFVGFQVCDKCNRCPCLFTLLADFICPRGMNIAVSYCDWVILVDDLAALVNVY
jgi:hypothetical protein